MEQQELKATFQFAIGETVYFRHSEHRMGTKPRRFTVIEQIAKRCHGGVQKFYALMGASVEGVIGEKSIIETALTSEMPPYQPITREEFDDLRARHSYHKTWGEFVATQQGGGEESAD